MTVFTDLDFPSLLTGNLVVILLQTLDICQCWIVRCPGLTFSFEVQKTWVEIRSGGAFVRNLHSNFHVTSAGTLNKLKEQNWQNFN
jgi:hypothetical protein